MARAAASATRTSSVRRSASPRVPRSSAAVGAGRRRARRVRASVSAWSSEWDGSGDAVVSPSPGRADDLVPSLVVADDDRLVRRWRGDDRLGRGRQRDPLARPVGEGGAARLIHHRHRPRPCRRRCRRRTRPPRHRTNPQRRRRRRSASRPERPRSRSHPASRPRCPTHPGRSWSPIGPSSQAPDRTDDPTTIATTATPAMAPNCATAGRRDEPCVRGGRRPAASCSMPADVRAQRSRGGSGVMSRMDRSATRSAS